MKVNVKKEQHIVRMYNYCEWANEILAKKTVKYYIETMQ